MAIHSRILKNGKRAFYNGNKKATDKEIKSHLKEKYNAGLSYSSEELTPDQRRYIGAVKGGKNRAASSLVNKSGHFLPANLQDKALKRLGINIEALKQGKQVKSIREIFKDNPEFQASFDKLISETGMPFFYNEDTVLDKISTYTGDSIYLFWGNAAPNPVYNKGKNNGQRMPLGEVYVHNIFYHRNESNSGATMPDFELTDKDNAVKKVSSFIKKLKRTFDLYYPGVAICLIYFGTDILCVMLDNAVLATGVDSSITIEGQSIVQLYHSNKGAANGKRKKGKK